MKALAQAHIPSVLLLPPRQDRTRPWALAAMTLVPVLCGCLALLLGADASWDLRNYHWYNAWAYLTDRRDIDLMPSQGQFFFNPWLDVPFFMLATHVPLKAAYFVLGTVQGLNFPLLFMIAYMTLAIDDPRARTATAAALAAVGIFSAIGISEIGTSYFDNMTSLGVLMSALLLLRKLEALQQMPARSAAQYACLAGIPAGLMAGLKLTCVSFSLGLCLALLVFTPQVRRCFLLSFFFGVGVTCGFLATYAHWGFHLFAQTGSPFFPFFNIIFRSPLMPFNEMWLDFEPPRDWRLLVFPFLFGANSRLVAETWWQDWRLPVLYALMLWLFVQYRFTGRRARGGAIAAAGPARFLLLAGGISYYFWLLSGTVYRYLLPLDMLAPLLIVICIGLLPLARRPRLIAAAAVIAALALTIQPANWGRHSTWPGAVVDVSLPPRPVPPGTMILMAGIAPYAYLLPAFPPDVRFLRLQSRRFPPDADYGLIDLIRRKLDAHRGSLKLLHPAREMRNGREVMRFFHLSIVAGSCLPVIDRLSESHLDQPFDNGNAYVEVYNLCDVVRAKL